jgi:hypothetical protein
VYRPDLAQPPGDVRRERDGLAVTSGSRNGAGISINTPFGISFPIIVVDPGLVVDCCCWSTSNQPQNLNPPR